MTIRGRRNSSGRARPGALLLEVILALTIFILVGLAATDLASHALSSMRRTADLRRAVDIARTTISRIELGELAPESASGPVRAAAEANPADGDASDAPSQGGDLAGWSIHVGAQPGPVSELTLVTVEVLRSPAGDTGRGEASSIYTLRQLVRLSPTVAAAGRAWR